MAELKEIEERINHTKQYMIFIEKSGLSDNLSHHIIKNEKITLEALELLRQLTNNGWIPCKERLPEQNKPVLCWVVSKTIASGETYIIGSCDRGFWFLQTYEIGHHSFPVKDFEVVAWQPLPESYKEEV